MIKILKLDRSTHRWEIISEREFRSQYRYSPSSSTSLQHKNSYTNVVWTALLRNRGWDIFGHIRSIDSVSLVWDNEIISIEVVYKYVSKLGYYVSIRPLIESYIRDQKIANIL